MNASTIRPVSRVTLWSTIAGIVGILLVTSTCAQSAAAPVAVASPTEVPDGSPQLVPEKVIGNTSSGATGAAAATGSTHASRASGAIVVNEERIQGRLAAAHVSVGGARGYTVVDPNAGRSDRQSDNGGKRLSPSLWELFRF